jgi:hypothetical protein
MNCVSPLQIYGCTVVVHVLKVKRKTMDDLSEECILIGYRSGNIYRLVTKKTRKVIIARDDKFDETLLGLGNLRNKPEPLYVYDDDEEKKDVQAPVEHAREPSGEKSALQKAKEVQAVLRRPLLFRKQRKVPKGITGKERFEPR